MGIFVECPACHTKQTTKNNKCKCGQSMAQAKKAKKARYYIRYIGPNGKRKVESVGTFKGLNGYSREDAEAALALRKVQKIQKPGFEDPEDYKTTFDEMTTWYLGLDYVREKPSFKTIYYSLTKFNKVFGHKIVASVKPADLKNYQTQRQKARLADATIDHEIGKTKTMIITAFNNRKVSSNTLRTWKSVKKLLKKGSDVRDRIISPEEFSALMEHSSGHIRSIIATAYYTGMRKGEILGLTWDRVDLANRMIYLEAKHTKDDEPRKVPICSELFEILRNMPNKIRTDDESGHVFTYKGQPMNDIRAGLRKACKDAGILYGRFKKGGFVFHDLRHTFNTNMRKAGVSDSVIMEITGHSSRTMFDRYNTIDDDDARQAVDQLETYFNGNKRVTKRVTKKQAERSPDWKRVTKRVTK